MIYKQNNGRYNVNNVENANDKWVPIVDVQTGAIEKIEIGASIFKNVKSMSIKRSRLQNDNTFKYVGAFNVSIDDATKLIEALSNVKQRARLIEALKSL